jgi:hypothetical protein
MFLLKAAPVLYFLISPVILYDGSWGHEPGRGLWALIKKKSSALITMLTNYFLFSALGHPKNFSQ